MYNQQSTDFISFLLDKSHRSAHINIAGENYFIITPEIISGFLI